MVKTTDSPAVHYDVNADQAFAFDSSLSTNVDLHQLPEKLEISTTVPGYDRFVGGNNDIRGVIEVGLESAINGDDYECKPGTIGLFVNGVIGSLEQEEMSIFRLLYNNLVVDYWFLYALVLFRTDPSDDVFYPNKQQKTEYEHRISDLQKFFDSYSEDINLYALSANLLDDTALMVDTLFLMFGLTQERAEYYIGIVRDLFEATQLLARAFRSGRLMHSLMIRNIQEAMPLLWVTALCSILSLVASAMLVRISFFSMSLDTMSKSPTASLTISKTSPNTLVTRSSWPMRWLLTTPITHVEPPFRQSAL